MNSLDCNQRLVTASLPWQGRGTEVHLCACALPGWIWPLVESRLSDLDRVPSGFYLNNRNCNVS
eukprot:124420-Rhodomonas_salina.5